MKELLIKWWKAHKLAEENPKLLQEATDENYEKVSDLCVARMKDVHEVDEALYSYDGEDIEPLVKLFVEHNKDKGCVACWINSNPMRCHQECRVKIAKWFGYRAALMTFVFETYIRHGRQEDQIQQDEEGREKE